MTEASTTHSTMTLSVESAAGGLLHEEPQPGLRRCPLAIESGFGDAESLCRRRVLEPREVAQLDEARLGRVLRHQLLQGFIEDDEVDLLMALVSDVRDVQSHAPGLPTPLHPVLVPGMVDEDVTHGRRCGAVEPSTIPIDSLLTPEAQPGLMNEGGRLQRMAGRKSRAKGSAC